MPYRLDRPAAGAEPRLEPPPAKGTRCRRRNTRPTNLNTTKTNTVWQRKDLKL